MFADFVGLEWSGVLNASGVRLGWVSQRLDTSDTHEEHREDLQ